MRAKPAGAKENAGRASAAFTALVLAGVFDAAERLRRADRATMAALPAWRTPGGVAIAHSVSKMAEPAVAAPLLALAAIAAARRGGWRSAGLPALAVPGGVLARWLLSEIIARPRPPAAVWLTEPEGYSLPSRHTALAALTAGPIAAALGTEGLPRQVIGLATATGVGASRIYLGVHWPTDVLAGWLFSVAWLGLAGFVCRPATRRCSRGRLMTLILDLRPGRGVGHNDGWR